MSNRSIPVNTFLLWNAGVLALCALLLFWTASAAPAGRIVPELREGQPTPLYRAETQRDVYGLLSAGALRGVHMVHANRFLNLVSAAYGTEARSSPFPLRTYDTRPYYEMAVDSHNWLFIASRTGAVRRVTAVLPDQAFQKKAAELAADGSFAVSGQRARGYVFDLPVELVSLASLPALKGPVILSIDAGYFSFGADPAASARMFRRTIADVRALILVESFDEQDTADADREKLGLFSRAWQETP